MKKMVAALSAVILTACGGGGGGGDDNDVVGLNNNGSGATPGSPSGTTGATGATPASDNNTAAVPSSEFLQSEYTEGSGEILLSRLALERASNAEVKQFAQLMIDHHTQANAEIAQLAQTRGLTLASEPSSAYQTLAGEWRQLSGIQFDQAYMARNVAIHEQEVTQYRAMLAAVSQGGNTGGAQTDSGSTGSTSTTTGASASAGAESTSANPAASAGSSASTDGTPQGTNATANATPSATGTTGTGTTANGAAVTTDAGVAAFVMRMQPTMMLHLSMAKEINGKINPSAYLLNLYQDGLAEIQLSTVALEKASNAEVRQYAQMMINDHTRANNEIAAVAQAKQVPLPSTVTAEQRAALDDISRLSGNDFDKAYMNHNVIGHAADVRQTEVQAASGTDNDVKALAARTLPALRIHLQEATELYQSLPASMLFAAYQDGLGEIILSMLAVQRAADPEVKQYAQRMITDHTQANTELTQLARSENIVLPKEASAETVMALMQVVPLTGNAFDRAYMENNVAVHQKDVTLLTDRATNEPDAELRAFAARVLPVLTEHLQEASALRDRVAAGAGATDSGNGTTDSGGTAGPASTTTGTSADASAASTPASPAASASSSAGTDGTPEGTTATANATSPATGIGTAGTGTGTTSGAIGTDAIGTTGATTPAVTATAS